MIFPVIAFQMWLWVGHNVILAFDEGLGFWALGLASKTQQLARHMGLGV